ncbi:MAG: GntR family transcriptional regulator [Opitutus sp.]|nr:GntR family transcriptional regulator [Opitutus sp.]MCS6246620.1 GntR family transcriptional regulator [Opitutus sp.]MCS6274812.1 GntR family transcriptional regulator [Opitutus sp.]MCS6276092.1 GntR family transcriptional regulator [Opitutus sp.]MCS6301186.1 GntR family transcriptional regulator [Opitutus sp.]
MPKKPTLRAREAELTLLRMLENKSLEVSAPLPAVRQLGDELGLSFATVSRLLQRLVREGKAWQHPNGRFYPVHAGSQAAAGLPIVVLGRQIQRWSRLYQEIIEGVSESCAQLGCPLMFLSSEKLVEHATPAHPPAFAPGAVQAEELQRLADAVPRLCAGILLDHLWAETLIATTRFPAVPRLLLARGSQLGELDSLAPDFAAGARVLLGQLRAEGCERVFLGVPFAGDPAVDAAGAALGAEAKAEGWPAVESLDCSTPEARAASVGKLRGLTGRFGLVCAEDNVTVMLAEELARGGRGAKGKITLAGMQGTGEIRGQVLRLRYNYRQMGREAVAAVVARRQGSRLIGPNV